MKLPVHSNDNIDAKIDEDNNLMLSQPRGAGVDLEVGVSSDTGDKDRVRHTSRSVENITITLNGEKMQNDPINGPQLNGKS